MKSKIRPITVDDQKYNWRVTEIDWDNVLLKVWVEGKKSKPWFTVQRRFNNPWYFIGQVTEENREKFQFEAVKPKHVSAAIKLVEDKFGLPGEKYQTLEVKIEGDGSVSKL